MSCQCTSGHGRQVVAGLTLQRTPALALPCPALRAETLAAGVAEEALAVATEAGVGTVAVDVQPALCTGGLAPLVSQPSHFSGHLDLSELWQWVGLVGMGRCMGRALHVR
jgi:hypothetical protein